MPMRLPVSAAISGFGYPPLTGRLDEQHDGAALLGQVRERRASEQKYRHTWVSCSGNRPRGERCRAYGELPDRSHLSIGGPRALPRPAPAHLQLEREAQERPDRHDQGEHP